MGVGKSTLAEGIAGKYRRPRCCVDEVQWTYLSQLDFDQDKAKVLLRSDLAAFRAYAAPFLLAVVERAVREHPDHVIDLGSGHSAYDEPDQVDRFKQLLAPIPRVVLLMPSPDLDVCLGELPGPESGRKMNPYFIRHPLKDEVAKQVIYTQGKTPSDVLEEASAWLE